jgi:LPS sulfotransferase NodH
MTMHESLERDLLAVVDKVVEQLFVRHPVRSALTVMNRVRDRNAASMIHSAHSAGNDAPLSI